MSKKSKRSKKNSGKKTLKIRIDLGGDLHPERTHVAVYSISKRKPKLVAVEEIEGSEGKVRLRGKARRMLYCAADLRSVHDGKRSHDVGDRGVELLSVFPKGARTVTLSERTTVASVFAFSQFSEVTKKGRVKVRGPKRGLAISLGMRRNLVGTKGKVSKVIQRSPNGLESNSWPKYNFLSNLVYFSLTTQKVYDGLLAATGASSVVGALHEMVRNPFAGVDEIFGLIARRKPVFEPSLTQLEAPATKKPDHWALSVKFNDSGAENFLPAGIGYAAFDENDRLWLANNVRQGTPNSATFTVVLEPDGKPAPFSPIFGGGVLGAGFGVAANPSGDTIYVGSFGWGPGEYLPQHGSVSAFSSDGEALSPPNGYLNQLSRVQGMVVDQDENLWMASWGSLVSLPPAPVNRYQFPSQNSAVVVYPHGDPDRAASYDFGTPYAGTFDVTVDDEGFGYVSNEGSAKHDVKSSVVKFRLRPGHEEPVLEEVACWVSDFVHPKKKHLPSIPDGVETLRQVSVAPNGDVFVVGVSSNRVVRLTSDLEYVCDYTNQINGPWGILFDPDGTMYVSNFSRPIDFVGDPEEYIGPFGVTIIRDYDDSTAEVMTLQTGGRQVRLANGLPLYGNGQVATGPDGQPVGPIPSYDPIMRLTGSRVDRAGNLWACNNWKPSVAEDVVFGDPGGDGMVCFLGVAAPSTAR